MSVIKPAAALITGVALFACIHTATAQISDAQPSQQSDTAVIYDEERSKVNADSAEHKTTPTVRSKTPATSMVRDSIVLRGNPMYLGVGVGCAYLSGPFKIDPMISGVISLPIRNSIFHIDVEGNLSGRYLITKSYDTTELVEMENIESTWMYTHTKVSNISGYAVTVRGFASAYLGRYHFGIGSQIEYSDTRGDMQVDTMSLFTHDTIGTSVIKNSHMVGVVLLSFPVLTFGVQLWDIDVALLYEPPGKSIGLRVQYLVKKWPRVFAQKR